MRLVTFSLADSADARLGALINNDQQIVDLRTAADMAGSGNKNFTSMLALIDAGPAALDSARDISARTQTEGIAEAIIEHDNARLHAPLPNPPTPARLHLFPATSPQCPKSPLHPPCRARN